MAFGRQTSSSRDSHIVTGTSCWRAGSRACTHARPYRYLAFITAASNAGRRRLVLLAESLDGVYTYCYHSTCRVLPSPHHAGQYSHHHYITTKSQDDEQSKNTTCYSWIHPQPFNGHTKTADQRTIIQQYSAWYTGRWWMGRCIWYSEEGRGRAAGPLSPVLAVPYVTDINGQCTNRCSTIIAFAVCTIEG